MDNPWLKIFEMNNGQNKYISDATFNSILEGEKPIDIANLEDYTMYVVNTTTLRIQQDNVETPLTKSFENTSYTTFFDWLSKQTDYVELDQPLRTKNNIIKYKIKSSIQKVANLSSAITTIFTIYVTPI
jgi:hypothetical protein